jgi:hypothetical protein
VSAARELVGLATLGPEPVASPALQPEPAMKPLMYGYPRITDDLPDHDIQQMERRQSGDHVVVGMFQGSPREASRGAVRPCMLRQLSLILAPDEDQADPTIKVKTHPEWTRSGCTP